MKKIIISLVLAFSLFFSFGNLQVNAEVTEKQEEIIANFIDNYFEKNKKKYWREKAILKLKELHKKVSDLKKIKTGKMKEFLDIAYIRINLFFVFIEINEEKNELIKSYIEYTKKTGHLIDSNIDNHYIIIKKTDWIYAKGSVLLKNSENYSSPYFLAVKVLNKWKVVFVWQDEPFCENIEKYNFSKEYVEWCFKTSKGYIKNTVDKNSNKYWELKQTLTYWNRTIKVYKKYTWKKYIKDFNNVYSKNRTYFLMKNDDDYPKIIRSSLQPNIIKETIVKITSNVLENEEIVFQKTWPKYWFCRHDLCDNSVDIVWVFNNKLFFTSYVNIINWKYFSRKKYVYDFSKNKLLEKDFWTKIKAWFKWIYFIRNNWTLGKFQNSKLILLDNNYNEKVLYEDNMWNVDNETMKKPAWTESLENFELLPKWKIKLFLKWYDKWNSSKIIQTK